MLSIMSQRQCADTRGGMALLPKNKGQKKGLILRPALKESLNQKVSKGPEETTSKKLPVSQKSNLGQVSQGLP